MVFFGKHVFWVQEDDAGKRLDILVPMRVTGLSRSRAAHLIQKGNIQVDRALKKPGYRVTAGQQVFLDIPEPHSSVFLPEPIHINVIYEDRHLIVVNKPPGMVVHPAPGHFRGTLVNALLHHCPDLEGIGDEKRPGIVHRLDRDTSGALIVAKTTDAHHHLSRQFKLRKVIKIYLAVVYGNIVQNSGDISLPIGRHPIDRKKMSTQSRGGRQAQTTWRIRESFEGATLLEMRLMTGRTHQIRVHCAAIGHPVVGDSLYGGRKAGKRKNPRSDFSMVSRHMLHAWRIRFTHPATEVPLECEAPVPQDMESFLESLQSK